MFGGIVITENISSVLVFLEGVLSFFSPCVIPLIPVYMSYLAGSAKSEGESGDIIYERKKVFLHTVFFVLGISFAFFILGMTFTVLGKFFNTNKYLFTRIGGIIIVILGLFQLGIFDFSFLQRERKVNVSKILNKEVNPLIAFIMGFTFSFAWTPCVGPMLSSVLIMASGAKTSAAGNLLVVLYTLGFVIPFLLLGLFTTRVLKFLQTHKKFLKYTIKAGGIILIIMGIMTFTGWMNGVSSYLNSVGNQFNNQKGISKEEPSSDNDNNADSNNPPDNDNNADVDNNMDSDNNADSDNNTDSNNAGSGTGNVPDDNTEPGNTGGNADGTNNTDTDGTTGEEEMDLPKAIDFTLTDQYGVEHTLSDYKGKVVFLNFWATWCPPCREEMPHIEELYKEYNLNEDEVVFLGVANPKSEEYPYGQDDTKEEVIAFIEDNDYTFPTVFDETGEIFMSYYVSSFPTTFMINKDGNVLGYVPGMMTKEMMVSVIDQTLESAQGE